MDDDLGVWLRVGCIGVDAGMVIVADPAYVLHRRKKLAKDLGKDWEGFRDCVAKRTEEAKGVGAQLHYDKGHPGLGVVVTLAMDGEYDVWGRFDEDGQCDELRISFDGLHCNMPTPYRTGETLRELEATPGPSLPCQVEGCSNRLVCYCDFEIRKGKNTALCWKALCESHRTSLHEDVDYCPDHAVEQKAGEEKKAKNKPSKKRVRKKTERSRP